jgi:hypothetical protein
MDRYLKVPLSRGEGFAGLLEVFHQIHCLVSERYATVTTFEQKWLTTS